MKLKHLDPEWKVERPVRAGGICFGVLSAIFALAAPFVEETVGSMKFFLCGIGYSAALAFLSAGLLVLPFTWRRPVFIGLLMIPVLGVLLGLSIMAIAYLGYPLAILDGVLHPLTWLMGFVIAVVVVLAFFGWYCHLSATKQATNS